MNTFLLVVHVITCVLLVIVVLLQSGKDGGIGMVGGGGSSQTIFGSSGGANFFTRFTGITALIFMVTSISLTVVKSGNKQSVFDAMSSSPGATSLPAATAPATAAPQAPAQAEQKAK